MLIESISRLRELYADPTERAVRKQIDALDRHCRSFVALSPFVVVSTSDGKGRQDASPRGGAPGFVKVTAAGELLIPDAPGNNRLDSLENIIETKGIGLLFLVPGVDETLRVNGTAVLSHSPEDLEACKDERRMPKLAIRVTVREAYIHCAKALMRSRLWDPGARIARETLPTINQIISDQMGRAGPVESQADMVKRYQKDL